MCHTRSKIYQRTLGSQEGDVKACARLQFEYEKTRKNMTGVLSQIAKDFPNLTVHDITHVDKLWEVADVIVGDDYPMTPLEGFVLGCAFLIHDSALSYEAVGGKDKLRNLAYWKDTYAELTNRDDMSEAEKEKEADFSTIRYIHAQEAETIIQRAYQNAQGETYYLLEDSTLRTHLGGIIGKIAASHHWSIEKVSQLPTQFNVIDGFPREWRVNPLKLACILRCADAGHIDNGRAPDSLYRILHLYGVSEQHWRAQNRLVVVDVDRSHPDRAIIHSTRPFTEEEFGAWNVAFDAVRVFDGELKASNRVLRELNKDDGGAFAIQEVAGTTSKEEMAQYLQTEGWDPFEACLHIDDVGGLISKLGGEALYGKEDKIITAIRELIQNARDAIMARYVLEPPFAGRGVIDVHLRQEAGETYVSVSDNGIGMSENVIKNCFLNFGCSLWNSSLLKTEYSGLRSTSFTAVGRYGIGFYSIFMVAASAEVQTRVYNRGTEKTIVLKFPNGLTLTPLKKNINSGNTIVSTNVTFKVDPKVYTWDGRYTIRRNVEGESNFIARFENVIKVLCAGLDVDVTYHENDEPARRIHRDIAAADLDKKQWLRDISYADDQNNPRLNQFIENNYRRLEYIRKGGKIVGLAAINIQPSYKQDFLSMSTVGGLASAGQIHTRGSEHCIGYLDSIPSAANRQGVPAMQVYREEIEQWAKRQYDQVKNHLDPISQLHIPYAISGFNVDTSAECLIQIATQNAPVKLLPIEECIEAVEAGARLVFILSGYSRGHERVMDTYLNPNEVSRILSARDILMWPVRNSAFLRISSIEKHSLYSFIKRAALHHHIELVEQTEVNAIRTLFGMGDILYVEAKK